MNSLYAFCVILSLLAGAASSGIYLYSKREYLIDLRTGQQIQWKSYRGRRLTENALDWLLLSALWGLLITSVITSSA